METINCDFCGSKNYNIVTQQTDLIHKTTQDYFSIVECNNCGLNYTNPRPSIDEMQDYYSKSYAFHHSSGLKSFTKKSFLGKFITFLANSPLSYLFIFIKPISNILGTQVKPKIQDPVLKYIKQKKIKNFLDIGCGSGLNPHFWGRESSLISCKKFAKTFGCEPNNESRKFLNNNGIICWSKIEDIEDDKKFDLIRMNWSLEHVHTPSKYFDFISSHLSANGRAIIAVPNYNGLIYHLAADCVELPIHLFHFSEESLINYSDKYNLEIVSSYTFSYPSMYSFSYEVGLLPKKYFFQKGVFFAKKFQNILNIFDRAGMGNDIVVILKKS